MAIFGTQKVWLRSEDSSATEFESQIIKNNGYISIQLHSVNYMSKGNIWQSIFGGTDKIALAIDLKYQSGTESINASTIQDVREVKVDKNYNLGIQKNIAVKIPAVSDAIALTVKMQALKTDNLQSKFEMLNKTEFQSALQLAPPIIGQITTIAALVKNLFTEADQKAQLEASYAGIISAIKDKNPIKTAKMVCGYLVVLSTNDGMQITDFNSSNFTLKNESLYYKDKQVENTYLVFNIIFEKWKGIDEKSNWFKKYMQALNELDKIELTSVEDEWLNILKESKKMWMDGNALLDDDATYIQYERIEIKKLYLIEIEKKYQNRTSSTFSPSTYADAISYIINDEFKLVPEQRQIYKEGREALPIIKLFNKHPLDKQLQMSIEGGHNIIKSSVASYLLSIGKEI